MSPTVGEKAARDLGKNPAAADYALPGRIASELARQVDFPQADIFDLTPCLAERTPDGHDAYTGQDTHWSPEGNAWVGDILSRWIAARWFARQDMDTACAPQPAAYEPIPAGLLEPVDKIAALAAAIVTNAQGHDGTHD